MTRLVVAFGLALTLSVSALGLHAQTTQGQTSPQEVRDRWNKTFAEGAPNLNREPSSVLVAAVRERKPGTALDLGTGEGRNALFLAEKGWQVTGVDISDVAIAEAKKNAATRKVRLEAVVGDLDTYDFGKEQWDLITSFYMHSWHDRSPTDVPTRIYEALKPGGLLVVEGFAKPEVAFGFAAEELSKAYGRLRILRNESVHDEADWDKGNKRHIVRFVAQKVTTASPAARRCNRPATPVCSLPLSPTQEAAEARRLAARVDQRRMRDLPGRTHETPP